MHQAGETHGLASISSSLSSTRPEIRLVVLALDSDSPIIIGSLALPTPLWLLWDGFDEPYQSLILAPPSSTPHAVRTDIVVPCENCPRRISHAQS
jgi:hypothetical protein